MHPPKPKNRRKKSAKSKAAAAQRVNAKVNKGKGSRPLGKTVASCAGASQKPAKNTTKPCDIASLTLTDSTSGQSLTCSSHAEQSYGPPVPDRAAQQLASYDLSMELLSDYSTEDDPQIVSLLIARAPVGRCPLHQHVQVTLTPLDSGDAQYQKDWGTRPPEPLSLPARPMPTLDKMAAWIVPFWNFSGGVMDLAVDAASCGVLFTGSPNHNFKALVRIYPNDLYTLTLSVPAMAEYEKKKDAGKDSSSASGADPGQTGGEDSDDDSGITLELSRNGTDIPTVDIINGIAQTVYGIYWIIKNIKTLLEDVPQFGFTYSFSASILEGSITGTWGNRIPAGPAGSGDRYTAVEPFFDIDAAVTLFSVSCELGLGFSWKVDSPTDLIDTNLLDLVAQIAFKASVEAGIKYHASSDDKSDHKVTIESEPEMTCYVEFQVNVFGKGLRADGGVTGGFEFEGSFVCSFDQPPGFNLKAGMQPIVIYAEYEVDLVLWDSKYHWDKTLMQEKIFYDGPIPKPSK